MGRRPRLLSLITALDTGGAEILLERLTPLFEREMDTLTVSLRPVGEVGVRMRTAGLAVVSCGMALKYDPRGPARLWRILGEFRPDIIHSHLVHANLLGRTMGRLAGVPVEVSSIHNERFDHRWEYRSLRLTDFLTGADVCIGRRVAVAMVDAGVVDPRRLRVVPNGVDTSRFAPASGDGPEPWRSWGFPPGSVVFGFVGRLERQKDIPNLLAAARLLEDESSGARFVVLGDGSLRRELEAQAGSLGLDGRVRFVGEVEAVPEALRALDAFVLPSAWEGLPVALLEAMATGLPVVATRVGSIAELVTDGFGGILVAPGDPRGLADAVRTVVREPERARVMGRRNRGVVESGYSLESNAEALLAIYRGLLGRFGRGSGM